jgi:hypothetical protein
LVAVVLLVIVATSIWVLVDADSIGVKKGQIQGVGDMGKWSWFFSCLGIWIFAFPFYLSKRNEFKEAAGRGTGRPRVSPDRSNFCANCGRQVSGPEAKFCRGCGHQL